MAESTSSSLSSRASSPIVKEEESYTSKSESPGNESASSTLVTDNMIQEEERLREETNANIKVSASLNEHEFSGMVASQRFTRLQHLLDKSGIYSKILLKKMEDQREQNKKQLLKKGRGRKKKPQEDSKDKTKHDDGSGSKEDKEGNTTTGMETKRRGRKRKAKDISSYQLSDFMDNEGKLRKRPKLVLHQTPPRELKEEAAKDNKEDKAVEDSEIDEERYFEGEPIPVSQPKLLTGGIMRPYQLEGMEWLKVLYENGVNGILADEMGLGKTIQCIALIAHLIEMGVKGPYLVVAPLSTVPNWVSEIKRFTPEMPVILYHGSIEERHRLRRKVFSRRNRTPDTVLPVFVTSYEVVMKDHKHLADREWKFLIVDEGHRIKNLNCMLIRVLKSYDAGNRLLLTGTPLQNNLAELWSLLNFILPDIFDDLNSFQAWFDFSSVVDDSENSSSDIIAKERESHILTTLHEILTPFLLRRLKSDVELKIPPKKEILVYAPLAPLQEKYYTSILNRSIQKLLDSDRLDKLKDWGIVNGSQEEGHRGEEKENVELGPRRRSQVMSYTDISDNQFEAMLRGELDQKDILGPGDKNMAKQNGSSVIKPSIMRVRMTCVWMMLRKCCNHPYLVDFPMKEDGELKIDEELITNCGKMMLLDRMLKALLDRGHKVLVFSQMTQMLDLLEDFMDLRELRYARLDGTMKCEDRATEMLRFKESPDCNVFLLSTRAGGLGINLTAADTVIIYDSDWNPQADLQAQDRCHRIGQTKPVIIYRYVTANTIDQRVVEKAASKRRLEKMVIHKGKFKGYNKAETTLTVDDLVELLKSVDHDKIVSSQDILSDSALEALLDRNFTHEAKTTGVNSELPQVLEQKHSEFFHVFDDQGGDNQMNGVDTNGEIRSDSALEKEKEPEKEDFVKMEVSSSDLSTVKQKWDVPTAVGID